MNHINLNPSADDLLCPRSLDELGKVAVAIQSALDVLHSARSDFFKSELDHPTDAVRQAELNLEYACLESEHIIRMFANQVRSNKGLKLLEKSQ